ncbi:MAG: hypothetical protein IT424_15610, partial [Pirellulales bacterium]|nr:hypothetical protein [Pirellulales bacterium]
MTVHLRFWRPAACLLALAILQTTASAAGWLDDFNDGNVTDGTPVTWSNDLFGVFPGTYDASSGDFQISHPGDTDGDTMIAWVDSVSFTDVYVRAQGTILPGPNEGEVGGNLALLARLDTGTASAYLIYMDAGGQLGIQVSLGGDTQDIIPTIDLPFNATQEVVLELDVVGSQISGFA